MDFKSKITLWLRHIWVKYRRLVLVIFIGWLIIFMINMIIKNRRPQVVLKNTYDPDTAVITNDNAPTRYQDKIKAAMDEYIKHCNNKDYNSAFDLLTDDCKDYLYGNSLVRFQNYVDSLFKSKKIYNYQAFSIFNGYYIYDVTILDDIGATGTTGNYDTFTEKYTFSRQNDGSFKISTGDFIRKVSINKQLEDENMIVKLDSLYQSYSKIDYELTIINRTDKYVDIADGTMRGEVTLNVNGEKRTAVNLTNAEIALRPGQTESYSLIFDKYFDDSKTATQINFNCVRLLENYDGTSEDTTSQADKYYSFNINL